MKLVTGTLVALACFYGFYCGAMAAWSYFRMSEIVEDLGAGGTATGPEAVREAIVARARAAGIGLDAGRVAVSDEPGSLGVRVRWTWPVITWEGTPVLEIPLSLERRLRRR